MIRAKIGICVDCPPGAKPRPLLAKGRCQQHYWKNRQELSKAVQATRLYDPPYNTKDSSSLKKYFDFHTANARWICENCGTPLNPFNSQVANSCHAHILPKSLFRSIAGCLDNHMLLGGIHQACSCHGQFDSSWHNAFKMNVFTLAVERFHSFKHLIDPDEYKKLPDLFYNLLNS